MNTKYKCLHKLSINYYLSLFIIARMLERVVSQQLSGKEIGCENSLEDDNKQQEWVPKKLNWTQILYDQNIFIDAELYRKWDRKLSFEGEQLLDKDIQRTRSNEEYFRKSSTKQLLKRITTFYCIQNRINYQQGLLEVVIPFALLHRKDFQTRKCYAYFNSFMRKYFPKVLTQKTIENRKQLPHAILGITLIQILLRYHYPNVYQIFKNHEVPISMIVTQELLTVFAKNVKIPLVYEIFNFFMNKKNKNYILYMSIAMIGLKVKEIFEHSESDLLHIYVNKNLKVFNTIQDLEAWFLKSEQIEAKTPKSFEILSKKLGFCDKSFFTFEDYENMMKLQETLIDFIMPVYREQIDSNPSKFHLIVIFGEPPSKKCQYTRLQIELHQNTIVYDQGQIKNIDSSKIIVIGYTKQYQKVEKKKFMKLIQEINITTNYKYKFMMINERLELHKSCEIY